MKLGGRDAARFLARPDPARPAILLHGADPMRVALKRQDLVAALIGPEGVAEMRLERLSAAEVRRDPASLADTLRARGFFGGQRAVLIEDATDAMAPACAAALGDRAEGDAVLVVAAGALGSKSALRKLFEDHPAAVSIAVYDDPPSADEVGAMLRAAGIIEVAPAASAEMMALAAVLDPGDLRQTIEKIALYKIGDPTPLTAGDIAACAPAALGADIDEAVDCVADARPEDLARVLGRCAAQGVGPVALCGGVTRHFRVLHAAASDPGGAEAGVGRMRPPLFGARRDRVLRQARAWGPARLEDALAMLADTEIALRSTARAPTQASLERTLLRLAMLNRR